MQIQKYCQIHVGELSSACIDFPLFLINLSATSRHVTHTHTHIHSVLATNVFVCAVWCGNRSPAPSAQAKFLSRSPLPLLKSLASPESSTALSLWHAASACCAVAVAVASCCCCCCLVVLFFSHRCCGIRHFRLRPVSHSVARFVCAVIVCLVCLDCRACPCPGQNMYAQITATA